MSKKNRKRWRGLGIWFALLGFSIGDPLIFHLYQTIDKIAGNNLSVDQVLALNKLTVYRNYILVFIIIVFWTFGTCIEILLNEIRKEKENQKLDN